MTEPQQFDPNAYQPPAVPGPQFPVPAQAEQIPAPRYQQPPDPPADPGGIPYPGLPQPTPPAAPASNGRPIGASDDVLDLDALEREGAPAKPFRFKVKGELFELCSPQDVDWQDLLAAMRSPVLFFRYTMPAGDVNRFLGLKVEGWRMEELMKGYYKHYGLPSPPNASALPG